MNTPDKDDSKGLRDGRSKIGLWLEDFVNSDGHLTNLESKVESQENSPSYWSKAHSLSHNFQPIYPYFKSLIKLAHIFLYFMISFVIIDRIQF